MVKVHTIHIRRTFFLLVLSLFLISFSSAYGNLETAQIGKFVDLNKTDQVSFIVRTSNPTNETILVNLDKKEFTNILNQEVVNLSINIENPSYNLSSGEKGESNITISNLQEGYLEGQISVTFSKEGTTQKTTLNSVIKLNVMDSHFDFSFGAMWKNILMAVGVIIIIWLVVMLLTRKPKKPSIFDEKPRFTDEEYDNRKYYKLLEPYTIAPFER